jgi:spermidine/putrescine transport system permease protein
MIKQLPIRLTRPKIAVTEKWILSLPPIIYLIILFLIPTLFMIIISFRQPGAYGGLAPLFNIVNGNTNLNLTLDNFNLVLSSSFLWQLAFRSLKYSILTTFICLLMGYPLAMLIAKSKKKYRDLLLLLIIIPFWSCFLIRVYAWMIILGPQSYISQFINYFLHVLHIESVNLLYSPVAVIVCLVYINLPFMILPLYANLEKHDDSLIEASRDLGATKLQSFMKITIPLSMPGILAGSALVFIPSIGMFVIPELVGNNCSLMIGNLIKQQFLQTMNWPMGSVTSIIMMLLVLCISAIIGLIARNMGGMQYARTA